MNTSTGLLLLGFIFPEQSLRCPPQRWLRPAGQRPLQPGWGTLRGQRYRLSGTAAKFPRASRCSPSPARAAHGSHTHLSWPAWSWGSACSRLGAARSLSARRRPPPRASPPPPLAAQPCLGGDASRGARYTLMHYLSGLELIPHPNWALSVSVITADRSAARRHEGWPWLLPLIGHAAVRSMCRFQRAPSCGFLRCPALNRCFGSTSIRPGAESDSAGFRLRWKKYQARWSWGQRRAGPPPVPCSPPGEASRWELGSRGRKISLACADSLAGWAQGNVFMTFCITLYFSTHHFYLYCLLSSPSPLPRREARSVVLQSVMKRRKGQTFVEIDRSY